ncbi:hypothetical protein ES332_D10G244100v1 [Gossypium tomentosum]|uniref:Heat shock 70 kDa protein 17 n=1 Tax=Gossypium tomentosum TaxID=34277 RepID=A0A5D2JAC7_GOSTO|nr:hypothetical protein ES332_D10G244100v1 [Gossypium tomentosum]
MLFRLGVSLSLLSLFLFKSESAVSSIDLGSEWLKIAVVNLKPGQIPITIAINEMSKRKSSALVAFQSETRLLAEEAAGIVARYPDKVFSNLRDMVGKPYRDVKRFADAMYLPFDVVEDFRGAAMIRVSDDVSYSVEELLGMILKYAANLAEFHSKAMVKDMVISVPPYFGQAERKGLMTAAELAGINVISLINEHSGAALQYGIDKDFSNGSRHVIFYDMGSTNTYAALVYFSAYNAKEFGKTVSANQFQMGLGTWRNMELRLVEYFADEFNKQVGNGVDVRKYPKAMAKLKKQVKRTKEILSANTAAPISVESLHDDRDFRSTITREKFEELCGDLWDKSLMPVKEVLKHSGLQADDIYAVELIGGATRVPKLQVKLLEYFGRKDLDKHLDADEAIVLGAALHAANLSDGIKLNRKLGMVDGSSYSFFMELDGPDLSKDGDTRLLLVPRMKKLPSKIFKSFNRSKDFELLLAYDNEGLLPPGLSSPVFAQYAVSGLTDAANKYSSRNLSSPIKTNLHFSLSRSGILSLDQAEAAFQVTEWIEVPKRNLTVENSTIASSNVSVDPGAENTSEQNSNSLESDGEISNASNSTTEPNTVDLGTEKKLKKMTFRIPLKIVEKTMGPGIPLSKESLLNAKSKLEALDKKDAERRRTAELKNNLEEYIYATKEKFETSEDFERISSNDERQSVIKKLDEVQEWLYTDGEDATATEFQERLNLLKAATDPIFFRFKELTARPEAVKFARRYLTELQQTIRGWEKDKPWLPKFKTWLDEKEAEQQKMSGFSMPVFTSKEVYEKPINNAETEKDTSGDEKPAEESDSSKNEEDKVEQRCTKS